MGRVTIKMIAKEAGVSIGTVERALNDHGRINIETKQHVLELADKMGYRPNKIASALRKKKQLRIAVVMPRNPNYFVNELIIGVEDARNELADFGIEMEYIFSETLNPVEQEPILRNTDWSKYDGIALDAGAESLNPYIDTIVDAGVPIVTFNTDAEGSKRIFYVGENPYSSGRVAGNLMGKIMGGHGRVAIFVGFDTISSHIARAAGFMDYIKEKYPKIKILKSTQYKDNDSLAKQTMQKILDDGIKLDGIFCVSTPGVVGVGECLVEHGLRNQICLIGYDVNSASAKLVKDGYCVAVMYQDPRKQSYKAITLLVSMLTGDWQPSHSCYFTRTKIVVAENMEDYAGDALEKGILQ